jgi:5S rRNA maturation endonuclease (ribonuclease M5)
MTAALPSIAKVAELLSGDVQGGEVLCPGPGHSAGDRSLSVKPDLADREGFVTHSFAGDGWKDCRDHVRTKLGLPEPKWESPKKTNGSTAARTVLAEYVYRDQNGECFLKVRKCRDKTGKKQFPQYHWENGCWANGKPDGPKIPYRLPELIAAPATATIYFVEGEKDADALAKIGLVATTASEGASAKWDAALTLHFKDRHVVILPDADVPGRAHAQKIAEAIHGVAASVRIVDLFLDRKDGSDVSDWIVNDNAGVRLANEVKQAPLWEPSVPATSVDDAEPEKDDSADTVELRRLAQLPKLQYERERKVSAKALGLRASILDRLVQAERDRVGGGDSRRLQGRALELPEPKPSNDPVNGANLLDEIVKAIQTYIVLSDHAARSCAVWTVYTFLAEHFLVSPRLCISSPVMGCGKSTLTDIISRLVLRPLKASNATSAAIFRVIEMRKPCLLIDEGDTFVDLDEGLRGILNSGHRHDGAVLRVVGEELEPRQFATFSPCSVALIGELPPTLADRSISIGLKRRRPADGNVRSFSLDDVGHLDMLARQSARWARDNAVEIGATKPEMADGIINRARDNWQVLKAIATVAGGEWPRYIDAAAQAAQTRTGEGTSQLERLLADIKAVAFGGDDNEVPSAVLVQRLIELEGRPWAEMGKNDKPLTQNKLARLLKHVGVAPEQVGPEDHRVRGYKREQFGEAFERYLSVSQPSIRPGRDEIGASDISEPSSPDNRWTDGKCEKPNNGGLSDGWTVGEGSTAKEHDVCDHCGRSGANEVYFSNGQTARLHHVCEAQYRLDEGHAPNGEIERPTDDTEAS